MGLWSASVERADTLLEERPPRQVSPRRVAPPRVQPSPHSDARAGARKRRSRVGEIHVLRWCGVGWCGSAAGSVGGREQSDLPCSRGRFLSREESDSTFRSVLCHVGLIGGGRSEIRHRKCAMTRIPCLVDHIEAYHLSSVCVATRSCDRSSGRLGEVGECSVVLVQPRLPFGASASTFAVALSSLPFVDEPAPPIPGATGDECGDADTVRRQAVR